MIGVVDLLKKGFEIWKSRLIAFVSVGVVSAVITWLTGFLTIKNWVGAAMAKVQMANPETIVSQDNFLELARNLPVEELPGLFLNPLLWIGILLALVVSLWTQAALILAAYPHSSQENQSPKGLSQVATGAISFMWRLFLIELVFGAAGLILGIALVLLTGLAKLIGIPSLILFIPFLAFVIYLGVYFGFAPLLLVMENKRVFESLKASCGLVKDRWLKTAARLGVILVVSIPIALGLSFIPYLGSAVAQILLAPFSLACAVALIENLKGLSSQEGV